MKRLIGIERQNGNSLTTLIAAVGIVILAGLACGGSKPAPAAYVGFWTGADGTTITIRADGSGDYRSENVTVDNGSVTIDEGAKTLKIGFPVIGPTLKIDKEPTAIEMTLSGVVYKKGGSNSDSKPGTLSPDVPGNEELQKMVKGTMKDFSEGVRSGDFGYFRDTCSKKLKDSLTPETMRAAFKDFIEQKGKFDVGKSISNLDATFEPTPSIVKNSDVTALKVAGYYPTTPDRLLFKFDYTMEDGSWKLSFIKMDMGNAE